MKDKGRDRNLLNENIIREVAHFQSQHQNMTMEEYREKRRKKT